jgi:large subunit ribosomal protein L3
MPSGILGEKVGMTSIFTETGDQIPVTVIKTSDNMVIGKRTEDSDGYTAVVLGFGKKPVKRLTKPELGYFEKSGAITEGEDGKRYAPRFVREFRINDEALAEYEVGATVDMTKLFLVGEKVDITGTTKGRGFTGVMKRHNYKGTKASHGVHEYFRHGGSIGSNTSPARVFKNRGMPGQYGNSRVTVQNMLVVAIMPEDGVILVRGGVPGPNGGLVRVRQAMKSKRSLPVASS